MLPLLVVALSLVPAALASSARAQATVEAKLPFRQMPIDYFGSAADEPVSRLAARLESNETQLRFRDGSGYLLAVLEALDIPVSSQMLVFAKNSVNARLIGPENPRALYFSDEVYVGWVPGAPALEISAADPQKGGIFYTLRQKGDAPARLQREESCLLCHASASALHVPGHLARSFLTDSRGNPTQGIARVTHDTPISQRWGGWYVTGDLGELAHQGNLSTSLDLREYERDREGAGRKVDLVKRLPPDRYPESHSDVVALMVHDHQLHLHNLITRINFEERLGRESRPAPDSNRAQAGDTTPAEEQLVRYLLFVDAPPLEHAVLGSSTFETDFSRKGPHDSRGRSLRQFDLESRLFKYRLSYGIYTRAFEGLPAAAKSRIGRRLRDVLTNRAPEAPFDQIPPDERRDIVEIVRETKPDLLGDTPAP